MKSKTKSATTNYKSLLVNVVLIITGTLLAPTTSPLETPTEENKELSFPFRWQDCLATVAKDNGKSDKEVHELIGAVGRGSAIEDPKFIMLLVSIIAVESQFNILARSSAGAIGLMQVMPVGAIEAERQCPHLKDIGNRYGRAHAVKLLDPTNNVRYGSCLLAHYMDEVHGNTFLALTMYNGGYKQLTRLEENATLATETREYVLRVHQQLRRCQQ